MALGISLLGFVIGLLVGVTGMGGGALMTPALILLGLARPGIAVGTDLVWGTLTKAVGAAVHFRQGNVDFKIVARLAAGSIPGTLAGLALLAQLHARGSEALDRTILRFMAIALMGVSLSLFARSLRTPRPENTRPNDSSYVPTWMPTVLGGVTGFLVSLTSVGSGSLIVAGLAMIYPSTPIRRIVGSDIFHALILAGLASLGHLQIGNINFQLLGALLLGSIPGVWVGGKMGRFFPDRALQLILGTTLLFLGYKLL